MQALITGFLSSLTLIAAIGSQNAFVLRQGLRRRHVVPVVLVCILSEALLISIGVFSSAWIATVLPIALPIMRWGGAAFLLVYGALSLRSALRGGQSLTAAQGSAQSLRAAVLTCLMLTWLNPHVYLDTVVLLGAISAEFGDLAWLFAIGAISGSTVFFTALGFGARYMAALFAKELSWRILDAAICVVMWLIAVKLMRGF
ncbi:L-lysine exporter family protein LysE/ArgO [Pacificibacter maritimus]|uniref:L-lysine exporter family protein LysE/ArgO n=1 Tax=Pacificibacter maritimus TaxID=762213 RepID=A0A3N4UN20_9RHOB|nr:LysE/ArgO family amino acid transporter [Pacificibacter maritimus]RPE72056.1 L-lysine exporter family protein LysE/ArgO [Pacificibacter maritimus]